VGRLSVVQLQLLGRRRLLKPKMSRFELDALNKWKAGASGLVGVCLGGSLQGQRKPVSDSELRDPVFSASVHGYNLEAHHRGDPKALRLFFVHKGLNPSRVPALVQRYWHAASPHP
jgi:hypothetical protein